MKPQGQWTAEESAQEADRQRLIERSATPKPRAGEHTRGPWTVHEDAAVIDRGLGLATIAHCYDAHIDGFPANRFANARRIVACVNACEGIVGELPNMLELLDTTERLITERDLLREALMRISGMSSWEGEMMLFIAIEALAKHGR